MARFEIVNFPMLGLYVHIPFCGSICSYCNFNRGLFDAGLKTRYVDALVREIDAWTPETAEADTIFFGGGTPSLLEPAEIARLIQACRARVRLAGDAEITLETNPETASVDRFEGFLEAGVNRISFGVQSFNTGAATPGRAHSAARAKQAIREARLAGFGNLPTDVLVSRADPRVVWQTVDEAVAPRLITVILEPTRTRRSRSFARLRPGGFGRGRLIRAAILRRRGGRHVSEA
jgi:oxygen-independent coproporphyrinogen-3 oxidase